MNAIEKQLVQEYLKLNPIGIENIEIIKHPNGMIQITSKYGYINNKIGEWLWDATWKSLFQ